MYIILHSSSGYLGQRVGTLSFTSSTEHMANTGVFPSLDDNASEIVALTLFSGFTNSEISVGVYRNNSFRTKQIGN